MGPSCISTHPNPYANASQ
jgi:hypothetical protein